MPGIGSDAYTYASRADGTVNRDPSTITADGRVYCFEGLTGYRARALEGTIVLAALTAPAELRLEARQAASCGEGPWTLGAGAAVFER